MESDRLKQGERGEVSAASIENGILQKETIQARCKRMIMKQPRVPEYRENENVNHFLKVLVLFLKDFCQEVWMTGRQAQQSIKGISHPVASVNKKTGDVELTAADVGALQANGTAADSAKLGGVPAGEYAKKSGLKFSELYYNKDSQAANPIAINSGMWTKVVEFSVPIPSDGQYLIIAGLALQAYNGGISTLSILRNGAEITNDFRATIPLASTGEIASATITVPVIMSAGNHILGLRAFPTVSCNYNWSSIRIVKVGD